MMKDYDKTDPFSVNSNYLTHGADIPSFMLKGYQNIEEKPWLSSARDRCLPFGSWERHKQHLGSYNIEYNLCISGSLFEKQNWWKTKAKSLLDRKPYVPN